MSKIRIVKNLIAVSASAFLLFLAYDGLSMLQSTMNSQAGAGVLSQATLYAAFFISSLLLPKFFIKKFGNKKAYVLSIFTYIPYIASNFLPTMELMIPTSIIIGLGASVLWVSQCHYLTDLSETYAYECEKNEILESHKISFDSACCKGQSELSINSTEENCSTDLKKYPQAISICEYDSVTVRQSKNVRQSEKITALFFGFHGFLFMSCGIWSNLLSYYILRESKPINSSSLSSNCTCGVNFCNLDSVCTHTNSSGIEDSERYIFISICVASAVLSILVAAFGMDDLRQDRSKVSFSIKILVEIFKYQLKWNLMLLIPAAIQIGMLQAFYSADFTKAFIACSWGTYHVGLVSVCYGVLSCVCCTLSGWLVKGLNRVSVITVTYLMNLGTHIFFLMWDTDQWSPAMLFIAAALLGASIGAIWSQIRAFYGVMFKEDEDAAFAGFHLWYSLGFIIVFSMEEYVCTDNKLYLQIIFTIAALIGYLIVEIRKATNKI